MNEWIYIILCLILPFVGTLIGSLMSFLFKAKVHENINRLFSGFAGGVMLAAAIFGLLMPAIETEVSYMPSMIVAILGFILGVGLLLLIDNIVPHLHSGSNYEEGVKTEKISKASKMFLAVTIHNIPEGLSVGVALGVCLSQFTGDYSTIATVFASALMISIGITVQNIPEGAVTALPLRESLNSRFKGFLFGTLSGVVEPIFGAIGLLLAFYITPIMPWALSFAAGCMIYVIIDDLLPSAIQKNDKYHIGLLSFMAGFVLMLILEFVFG